MVEIILAGGLGTRFWPSSRRDRPKQFLELIGRRSMLERTVERLRSSPVHEHTIVLVDEAHVEMARSHLPDADDLQILVQPSIRETAPAVALSTLESQRQFGDTPVGIFPADHVVERTDAFHRALEDAEHLARHGHVVTFGIEPDRPETGYGYIRHGDPIDGTRETTHEARAVRSFVEKPDRETARTYLESGDYLWNAGISVFRPSRLVEEMRRQMPDSHEHLDELRRGLEHRDRETIDTLYDSLEPVSLDRGILEGAERLTVLPLDVGWSDVGHWAALSEIAETDDRGNAIEGSGHLLDCHETVVQAEATDRTVVGVDLEGWVVVDTPDAVLVVPEDRSQRVREIVERLEEEGRDDLL
jgi:mannose-1-phosphate guanylyltransferase